MNRAFRIRHDDLSNAQPGNEVHLPVISLKNSLTRIKFAFEKTHSCNTLYLGARSFSKVPVVLQIVGKCLRILRIFTEDLNVNRHRNNVVGWMMLIIPLMKCLLSVGYLARGSISVNWSET